MSTNEIFDDVNDSRDDNRSTSLIENSDNHSHGFSSIENRETNSQKTSQDGESNSDESNNVGFNPQEASILDSKAPHSDFDVTIHNDYLTNAPEDVNLNCNGDDKKSIQSIPKSQGNDRLISHQSSLSGEIRKKKALRHRRGKESHAAKIVDNEQISKGNGLSLPLGHCNTVLIRRAIRKRDDAMQIKNSKLKPDDYGDISLGMKLSVIDGKVIVQHLNHLDDGRASPAQLTGVISRGDVLLSINQRSLLNLPLDQLMSRLSPLSTPDATGCYQRKIRLRIAKSLGLDLIESIGVQDPSNVFQNANDMLALFPMVDQLSGMPFFEKDETASNGLAADGSTPNDTTINKVEESKSTSIQVPSRQTLRNQLISQNLAVIRSQDRETILREFETWNGNFVDFFDSDVRLDESIHFDPTNVQSLSKLVEVGLNAMVGAAAISSQAEDVDAGRGLPSHRSWNTTMSIYSLASNRRKRKVENGSSTANFSRLEEKSYEDLSASGINSLPSAISEDGEKVNADETLLRLAAHDEIWRKQMIDNLLKMSETEQVDDHREEEKTKEAEDIDSAVSNFLFGTKMTHILKKQGKPRSLPSEEITAILFDLTTKVASSVPDEIIATGDSMRIRSNYFPPMGIKQIEPATDAQLATRFLLDEALPVWLKSFRPLPWEYRRIIWPLQFRIFHGGSTAASSMSDDLTIETMGTTRLSVAPKPEDDLVSAIEDREMNTETRGETCFLVTYFFTQALLPQLKRSKGASNVENKAIDNMLVFLGEYGSYVTLHTCLVYAAMIEAEPVIDILLSIAKNDPRHREASKQIPKSNQITFYEPSMLSALVQRLYNINGEKGTSRKKTIIELCSSAYSDIRPWQVKKYCLQVPSQNGSHDACEMENLYYTYLSLLLHPHDGNETARRDSSLVAEWCEMSVKRALEAGPTKPVYLNNFLSVARIDTAKRGIYFRDRVLLLSQCMELKDNTLALDLVYEIVDDSKLATNEEVVLRVMAQVREIAFDIIDRITGDMDASYGPLKRVISLYTYPSIRNVTMVSSELVKLLERRKESNHISREKSKVFDLLEFIAKEAIPSDVLDALATFANDELSPDILSLIQKVMKRGVIMSSSPEDELSAAMFRLRWARRYIAEKSPPPIHNNPPPSGDVLEERYIWRTMARGMLTIEK